MDMTLTNDAALLDRIAIDPAVMVGEPVIKKTRLTVAHVVNLLAHGMTVDEVLAEYEGLERKDVQACMLFASKALEGGDV